VRIGPSLLGAGLVP